MFEFRFEEKSIFVKVRFVNRNIHIENIHLTVTIVNVHFEQRVCAKKGVQNKLDSFNILYLFSIIIVFIYKVIKTKQKRLCIQVRCWRFSQIVAAGKYSDWVFSNETKKQFEFRIRA